MSERAGRLDEGSAELGGNKALLSEAEILQRAGDEIIGGAGTRCARCESPATWIQVVDDVAWFVCAVGCLNALGFSDWREAA